MSKEKIMKVAIVIVVLLIPIIYSFFYLKAYWDPYGNISGLPVAIVNLDKGTDEENLGEELVNKLIDKGTITIDVLDQDEAQTSLVNEEYYAVITIPKDFTETIENVGNKDRKIVSITYSPNQKKNLIASQIIDKVVTAVETEVTSQISEGTVETLCSKLEQIPDELQAISDGASQIQDGAQELVDGAKTLSNGTTELSESYGKFDSGVASAYSGSTKLSSGINSLADGIDEAYSGAEELEQGVASNLTQLSSGVDELASGTNNINEGISSYVDGVNSLNTNVDVLINAIINYGTSNPSMLADDSFKTIYGIASKIKASQAIEGLEVSGDALTSGAYNLNKGMQSFKLQTANLSELTSAISMLKDGIAQLKDGTEQLKSGSVELETGLNTLNENSKKIDTAIGSISDGTKDLLAGEQELSDGVDTFKAEIDEGIESSKTELESVDGLSEYISDPVEVDKEAYGEVKSYGYSFAPFFMSISLWVGALMVFIVIYYDPENRFKILGRKSEHRFTRLGLYVLIAILQALILGFLLKFALGFTPTNELLYYGSCVIVSLVFFSIMQFFIFNLKDVGKFIALILLILQLAASGGTFPIETIPSGFQAISPFMPMTYSIQLFKEALISIDTAILYKNLGVLIAIWLVFLTGSFIGDVVRILKEKKAKK